MAEPHRHESPFAPGAADRDSRAEALLVEGLDRYFAGDYDQAIHLWTRVLFLDRSHARARAYIDRARTALAERQRRVEETLHASEEWLTKGDVTTARRLLVQAIAAGGEDERAASLRAQLERLERARHDAAGPALPRAAVLDAQPIRPRRFSPAGILAGMAIGAGVVMAVVMSRPVVQPPPASAGPGAPTTLMSVGAPSAGAGEGDSTAGASAALARAQALYDRGLLAEALRALDRVPADGPDAPAAEALRQKIQQLLLAPGRAGGPARAGAGSR
jgi:tetratricopeptide (TPR) repeat protein